MCYMDLKPCSKCNWQYYQLLIALPFPFFYHYRRLSFIVYCTDTACSKIDVRSNIYGKYRIGLLVMLLKHHYDIFLHVILLLRKDPFELDHNVCKNLPEKAVKILQVSKEHVHLSRIWDKIVAFYCYCGFSILGKQLVTCNEKSRRYCDTVLNCRLLGTYTNICMSW